MSSQQRHRKRKVKYYTSWRKREEDFLYKKNYNALQMILKALKWTKPLYVINLLRNTSLKHKAAKHNQWQPLILNKYKYKEFVAN